MLALEMLSLIEACEGSTYRKPFGATTKLKATVPPSAWASGGLEQYATSAITTTNVSNETSNYETAANSHTSWKEQLTRLWVNPSAQKLAVDG